MPLLFIINLNISFEGHFYFHLSGVGGGGVIIGEIFLIFSSFSDQIFCPLGPKKFGGGGGQKL